MLNLEIQTSNEWHVLKGEHQFGPYTYEDMLKMKQNNVLFDFDYVWSPHMDQWSLVGDLSEFSVDRLHRLVEKAPDSEVFNRRASPRLAVDFQVLVHNDSRMWKGRMQSISTGGALILMENPLILPGDVLSVHVRSGGRIRSGFNCTAQVLNKRLVKSRIQHDTALHYAVKFLNLTEIGQTEVGRLFEEISKENKVQKSKEAKGN
jgi:hypothetical protein